MKQNPFQQRLEAYRQSIASRGDRSAQMKAALETAKARTFDQGKAMEAPKFADQTVARVAQKKRSDEGSRSNTINQGINAVAGVADKAVDLGGTAADVITPFNGPLEQATDKGIGQTTDTLHNAIDDTRATTTGVVSDISQAGRDAPQAVGQAVTDPVGSAQSAVQQTGANVAGGATQVANHAQGGAQAVASQAQNLAANPSLQAIADKLGLPLDKATQLNVALGRQGGLAAFAAAPPGSARNTDLMRLVDRYRRTPEEVAAMRDKLNSAAQSAGSAVGNAAQSVGNAVSSIANTVTSYRPKRPW